jgi:hypothetical protein
LALLLRRNDSVTSIFIIIQYTHETPIPDHQSPKCLLWFNTRKVNIHTCPRKSIKFQLWFTKPIHISNPNCIETSHPEKSHLTIYSFKYINSNSKNTNSLRFTRPTPHPNTKPAKWVDAPLDASRRPYQYQVKAYWTSAEASNLVQIKLLLLSRRTITRRESR